MNLDEKLVDRDSDCPGCIHAGVLTTECEVYKQYGNGKHWFIQPAGEFLACDFCNAVTEPREEDEWNNWS